MPGFLGVYGNKENGFGSSYNQDLIIDTIDSNKLYIERRTIDKFLQDKCLFENEDYIVVIEGVIINLHDLKELYKVKCVEELIGMMYASEGEAFIQHLRGSFSGAFYDKKNDLLLIFTNQVGDKFVFYTQLNNRVIFGSEIDFILDYFYRNNINFNLDMGGAYSLLTYGYMLKDWTLIESIRRLQPGHYLKIQGNSTEIIQYHHFCNKECNELSEEEMIENINNLFLKAVNKQIKKNNEYGYKNFAFLSAGLDSRMTNYAMRKLTNSDIFNITFSETDYFDEIIPKKIARELKNHWIFASLDNGLCTFYMERVVPLINGMSAFGGSVVAFDILSNLNWNEIGLIHSGQLGDVVVGTFFKENDRSLPFTISPNSGEHSSKLFEKLKSYIFVDEDDYDNKEIGMLYNRGFNGALSSHMALQNFTETFSPFYDLDFIEYCLSLPSSKRWAHGIYYKWVVERYPEAAKYEHNGLKITALNYPAFVYRGEKIKLNYAIFRGLELVKKKTGLFDSSRTYSMNPSEYWYDHNLGLREYMDSYFKANLPLLKNYPHLYEDAQKLYLDGNCAEKKQVLTLLVYLKHIKEFENLTDR
ncbi:hypothetical protein AZH53_05500 [Methanomicrobiaceae archaeon CYW5]|uniref:hypothetical protein n=1 Tax=Methanovulcanius yangii TaxID=1789227 RepID=UPI0029C9B393|nr:hypothetical protein [Methanovulcanius yangii]MBT8507867.1 hypothetical protein [Methanovulcanius yangii]